MSKRWLARSRRCLVGKAGVALFAVSIAALVAAGERAEKSPTAFEIADQLDLVPTPQDIRLTGQVYDMDGWTIVAAEGNTLVESGVSEINDRVERLGGRALSVSAAPVKDNAIVVAPCTHELAAPFVKQLEVRSHVPGEQGYAIDLVEQGGRKLLLAIGSDDLGTLYACMTVRRLIQPRGGKAILLGAKVRDWPAFKRRCLGRIGTTFRGRVRPGPNETLAGALFREFKPYVQWLARHKINMTALVLPRSIGDDGMRRIMDYGRRYGLKYRYIYGTAINEELKETGTSWTGCVVRQSARHCWTAFEAHRRKARKIAEHVQQMGYDYVVHHVTDSGGLPDPEKWSERCDRCRKHYGDDHPRAAAEQLKLYHDAIKELSPDVLFEAVIQPYHFQWTVEGFCENPQAQAADMPHFGHTRGLDDPETCRRVVARAAAIHKAVAAALPPDALVTFREAGRPEFNGVCRLWQGHPVDVWVYYGRNMAWEGLWEPQVRFTRTWWRNEPRDLVYNAPVGRMATVNEVYAAGSAEYAWNLNQPDAEPAFTIRKRRYLHGGNDVTRHQRESLLPRVCRRLWGRSGEAVVPLFANNISFNYMGQPEFVASSRGEDLEDPYALWDEQVARLREIRTRINREVAAMDAGRPSGVYGNLKDEPGYTSFMYLYYYTNLAALKGEIESGVLRIKRLVAENRLDDAQAVAAGLRKRLPEMIQAAAAVKERVAKDPSMSRRPYYRETPPGGKRPVSNELSGYPFEEQPERIASLIDQMKRDALLGGVPEHLREWLPNRRIEVAPVRFKNPFQADGHRGEGGWTAADPVEFFTVGSSDRLARFATRVWIRRDDEALYLIAEMRDPTLARPVAKERPRDGAVFGDDCFELFLAPKGVEGDYYHFAVNAAGSTFDAQGRQAAGDWNPEWQSGTAVARGFWTAELRIPFAAIGAQPRAGEVWRINLARHRAPKPRDGRAEISNIIGSPDHHARDRFRPLVFVESPRRTGRSPEIRLLDVRRKDMTVTYGFATQLWLKPEIRSWRQSHDARVEVAVFKDQRQLAAKTFAAGTLSGYWTTTKEVDFDLGDAIKGDLRVLVRATAADQTIDAERTFSISAGGKVR